jgi:HSP20 family protein
MALQKSTPRGALTAWRPIQELDEIERHFEDLFSQSFQPIWRRMPVKDGEWMPAIDIFEKNDKFIVKAELPGMKQEDIDVSLNGNYLIVKGKKSTESEVKEQDYYRSERSYGSFYRSIPLPSTVDEKKIEANYEDGVLEISIPKTAEVKQNKIKVRAKNANQNTSSPPKKI